MSIVNVKAIVDGVEIELEQNTETKYWEATAVAPAKSSYPLDGHYYGVTIIATDQAGNETEIDASDTEFGEALRLIVKETVLPEIVITAPTEGELTSNPTPTIEFTVTDDDSGVDPDTITLKIDGDEVTGFTTTEIEGGYSVSYTCDTLEDGEHTIEVNASDFDGNEAETASVNFTVQSTAASLAVTSPTEGEFFNSGDVTVAGTTDGARVTVQIGDGDPVEVEIVDGVFSQTFTVEEGETTITITAYTDSGVETVITRTITVDTRAPRFVSVSLTPNPVDTGKTYIISVEVVDE